MNHKNSNCTIYIVRHGETEFNVANIMQGHTDSPLTETGVNQAKALGEVFKDINFDVVFSSDSLRARRTAEFILSDKNLMINTSKILRERNYGKYDGGAASIFREENKDKFEKIKTLNRFEKRMINITPDVESDEEMYNRLVPLLRELAVAHTNKTVLVTTHGGIIRVLLSYLGWSGEEDLKSGSVKNTAYVKLFSDGTDFIIDDVQGVDK
ncbi:MAG: histidine phosphatase family protein [Minisyncoccia bacterium]